MKSACLLNSQANLNENITQFLLNMTDNVAALKIAICLGAKSAALSGEASEVLVRPVASGNILSTDNRYFHDFFKYEQIAPDSLTLTSATIQRSPRPDLSFQGMPNNRMTTEVPLPPLKDLASSGKPCRFVQSYLKVALFLVIQVSIIDL